MAALRETSVVFGAIVAAVILKEPLGRRRIVLAGVLALGSPQFSWVKSIRLSLTVVLGQ
jgi:drug/metabolite transporter (DMT)-like permease